MKLLGLNSPEIFIILVILLSILGPKRIEKGFLLFKKLLISLAIVSLLVSKNLSNLNLKVVLYSKLDQINADSDILLVDSYGESAKFYNISNYVFVGKSLAQTLIMNSGQNPIEPARFGCKIFHGPNVHNFVEIYKYLETLGVTKKVNNSEELSLSLVEVLKENKGKNHEISIEIQKHGQNIFNNVIIELKKYI